MVKLKHPLRQIGLFAGIGCQENALLRAGIPFEQWAYIDFDKYACQSFNAIWGTEFTPTDICDVHGKDLNIVDTDEYQYLVTYSFPCTDLSVAGAQKGMSRESNTRSGLLWEVERILKELVEEGRELPQTLLMENVTQVHGKKNIDDFNEWISFLESIGYHNNYDDLNAREIGTTTEGPVAQNRNRTFMVSRLRTDEDFIFPDKQELKTCMADYLNDDVPGKFFIKNERAFQLIADLIESGKIDEFGICKDVSNTIRRGGVQP